MKLVYDLEEKDLNKKLYMEEPGKEPVYLPFWDIKVSDETGWDTRFKRWPKTGAERKKVLENMKQKKAEAGV